MRQLLLLFALVLLIRLPFLGQAVQGDDFNYLTAAQYAQTDPAHPHHARLVFLGLELDMRGHPHPPLNAWTLAALLALRGDVREPVFHAAYMGFSLLAVWGVWLLARRFAAGRELEAGLLFIAVPAFVVNGTSLEADLPLLAFWTAAAACYVEALERRSRAWLGGAAAALALAALDAYQSAALVPILGCYAWRRARRWMPGWLVLAAPLAAAAGYQACEWLTGGGAPASVLAGHMREHGLQRLALKLKNAAVLTVHLGWMACPALALAAARLPRWAYLAPAGAALAGAWFDPHPLFWGPLACGVLLLVWTGTRLRDATDGWPAAWLLLFFAAALALFFAGAARYLLPLAAPLALLLARALERRPGWLRAGAAANLALGLALAWANYDHWEGYRRFAAQAAAQIRTRRVWVEGEWGLRFYTEAEGALPLVGGQTVRPGDGVISGSLSPKLHYTAGGGAKVRAAEMAITPHLPLRLVGAGSGYSTVDFGLRAFGVSAAPADRVWLDLVVERKPQASWLPMNAPEAEQQIVSGIYGVEEGGWRWMSGAGALLLKPPARAARLAAEVYLPGTAPGRVVTLALDGRAVARATLPAPGRHTVESGPLAVAGDSAVLTISIDRDFTAPGDSRRLGLILSAAGFRD